MATAPDDPSGPISLKVPPHSVEAERSVLGGLMLDANAWDLVSDLIIPDDFYRSDNRAIFNCLSLLASKNQPLDVITLGEELESRKELEQVGGRAYIDHLVESTPTAANVKAYANIVRERAILRKLGGVGHEIADLAFNPDGRDSATLLDLAESRVFAIGDQRQASDGPVKVKPLLTKAIERIDMLIKTKGALTGLSTGFEKIDEITSGLQNSDLIIVAGRPSMGKTSFAMNMAENVIMTTDLPVLVFSMEMPADSLVLRMLSSLGHVDQTKIRTGQLTDDDWVRVVSAVTQLNEKPLLIDDSAALTPNEIRSRTRRVAREYGKIGMIVVDYLQLMQVSGTSENRAGEISEISRSLKGIAKEFDCPLIAGSQLNRGLEQRPDKRPIMSDLRESGAIEQDADVIMGIYRDEVYHEDAEKGVAEIIILKQRNGPIGKRKLAFVGQYTRFEDLAEGFGDGYEEYL